MSNEALSPAERETLDQTGQVLFYFRDGPFGDFGNFARFPVTVDGVTAPTSEHEYQARKSPDPETQTWIRQAPTPWLAMKAGRALRASKGEVKKGWDDGVKFGVMHLVLRAKFTQHRSLLAKLLATGDATIHENSTPETAPDGQPDMTWGIMGQDMLGKLLMKVRAELREDP